MFLRDPRSEFFQAAEQDVGTATSGDRAEFIRGRTSLTTQVVTDK